MYIPGTTYLHILLHCTLYLIAHLTHFISLFVSYFIFTIFIYIHSLVFCFIVFIAFMLFLFYCNFFALSIERRCLFIQQISIFYAWHRCIVSSYIVSIYRSISMNRYTPNIYIYRSVGGGGVRADFLSQSSPASNTAVFCY